MIPSMVEKAAFGFPAIVLFAQGRLSAATLGAGLIDMTLGVLFAIAYVKTRGAQ